MESTDRLSNPSIQFYCVYINAYTVDVNVSSWAIEQVNEWMDAQIRPSHKKYCTKHFGIPQLQQIAIFHKSHKKCYIILWGELNLLLIFPVQITQKYLDMVSSP